MLTDLNSHYYVIFFGVIIALGTVLFRYRQIANLLKWFALSLFTLCADRIRGSSELEYPSCAKRSCQPGQQSMKPGRLVASSEPPLVLICFLAGFAGVGRKRDLGPVVHSEEQGAKAKRIRTRKLDVAIGTLFSNLAMYFIILTTALTLHRHGITNIDTSDDAAAVLIPLEALRGHAFYGWNCWRRLVSIPTLITSAAYALAGTFRWKDG